LQRGMGLCYAHPRRSRPSLTLVWRRAATAGWARPSLMVGHVGARYQRAQDIIQMHQTAQSTLAEGASKARKPMSLAKKKAQTESP